MLRQLRRTAIAASHGRRLLPLFLSSNSHSACKNRNPNPLPEPSGRIAPPDPPKKIPFGLAAHGMTWQDPYRWMRNTDDPDLVEFLKRENEYVEAWMGDTWQVRRKLVEEMKGRMNAMLATPPEQWGPWMYYQYIPEGKEYPVLCRKLKDCNSDGFFKSALNYIKNLQKEEILLDWNQIAEQFGYVHIGTCQVSPNHKFIAYTVDKSGSESFDLYIKDLQKDEIISSLNNNGVVSLAWTGDSKYLFYTVSDAQRPFQVFCRKVGASEKDRLIFTENDENCVVDITNTKDFRFITINSNSRSSSEEGLFD